MDRSFIRSDEIVIVPIQSNRYASWGQTVELYARFINLTMRDIRLAGGGFSSEPFKEESRAGIKHSPTPYQTLSRQFISPPQLITTVELNPDYFDIQGSGSIWHSYQVAYENSNGGNSTAEGATWVITIPRTT
jgi:hypothetical protein